MVLDFRRVFAEQVWLHRLDHRLCRSLPAVDSGLADTNRSVLAVDLEKQPPAPEDGLDFLNLCGIQSLLRSIHAVPVSNPKTVRRAIVRCNN